MYCCSSGRHKVEIMYAGQVIKGSPFFVEIYDPNKIHVEGAQSGTVGQPLSFEGRYPKIQTNL